jgi:hypothetical protein
LANFLQETTYPSPIGVTPLLLWQVADEALFAGVTGVAEWVQISAGTRAGATGIQGITGSAGATGETGISGETGVSGSSNRVYTWVVASPSPGWIPGPQLHTDETAIRCDYFVADATNCIFNLQDRTSAPNTAGLEILSTDGTATTADTSSLSFSVAGLKAFSWLGLQIDSTSGTPKHLTVTLTTSVAS